jgi:hypothetical protein
MGTSKLKSLGCRPVVDTHERLAAIMNTSHHQDACEEFAMRQKRMIVPHYNERL